MKDMSNGKKYTIIGLVCGAVLLFGLYFVLRGSSDKYKVTFNSDGGTEVAEQTVNKGEKVNRPTDPTKENYSFIGWLLDGVEYDFDKAVESDLTLIAKWEEMVEVVKYDVTFKIDDKEKVISLSEITEDTLKELGFEEKDGYEIKWYLDDKEYDLTTKLAGNISLVGKYVKISEVTVKFNSDGGTNVESKKLKVNETVSEPGTITKEGYVFVEWQLDGKKYDFSTPVTKSITLKAKWEEDPDVKRYEVKFDSDGGSKVDTQRIIENKTANTPKTPTKNGYKFIEWQLDGKKYDFKTKVTKDITLKAKWEEDIKYTVTFDTQGGTNIANQIVKQGEKVKKPADPTKSGYKFVEWLLLNSTYDFNKEVNSNITLVARYERENITPTPTPKPATPTPTAKPTITPTVKPTTAPTPKPYTFKAIPVDDYSPDVEIKVYDGNNNSLDYTSITIEGTTIQSKVVNKYEISGVNSITVKLSNGNTITAVKG